MSLRVAIPGINGRMGLALAREILAQPERFSLVGLCRSNRIDETRQILTREGFTLEHSLITDRLEDCAQAAIIIDFTRPHYSLELLPLAEANRQAIVSGTTGFTHAEFERLQQAATQIPLLWASNMSIGVNLLMRLVEQAAATLNAEYDIEILEMHHRHKIDAPSGTALSLGEAAARGRHVLLEDKAVFSRVGQTGERQSGDIGFATMRGGSVIGDHRVVFAGANDRIELAHLSQSRQIYAQGAIHAARWITNQPAGFYTFSDSL